MQTVGVNLVPLPILRAAPDEPRQVCRLTVTDAPAAAGATLHIRREGANLSLPLDLPAGTSEHEVLLPEATQPCRAAVGLSAGELRWTTEAAFGPVRRWQVFLVNHSHTDIGFTHRVGDAVAVHNKNLEHALDHCDATADWPSYASGRAPGDAPSPG